MLLDGTDALAAEGCGVLPRADVTRLAAAMPQPTARSPARFDDALVKSAETLDEMIAAR